MIFYYNYYIYNTSIHVPDCIFWPISSLYYLSGIPAKNCCTFHFLFSYSAGGIPYDKGSHQEVTNSIFVGESDNLGTKDRFLEGGRWIKGSDGRMRTYPGYVKGVKVGLYALDNLGTE